MENEMKELNLELNRLYKEQSDLYHEYASHYGLSDTSFWILYALCESEETCTQNMLARMWHFPVQSVNSAVSKLIQAGYIQLEQMAVARNNKAIRLTEEGEEFCRRVIYTFYELEERVLQKMSPEERRLFVSLSGKQCLLLGEEVRAALSPAE